MPTHHRTRVLYIAGSGRSGSTLLGSILGQIDGFFFPGEVEKLWDVSLAEGKRCGCGQGICDCLLWQSVLKKAFGDEGAGAAAMVRLKQHKLRTHEVPLFLLRAFAPSPPRQQYMRRVEALYHAIHSVTGSQWIIDSSKIPSHAFLLSTRPSVDLRIVHLVRDPRAVAYSWQRGAINGHQPPLPRVVLRWNVRNLVLEAMGRAHPSHYMRLRYEDFATEPFGEVQRIINFMDTGKKEAPFVSDTAVRLSLTHTVWGNPNRHKQGIVEIRQDEQWKRNMARSSKTAVTALSWPLLLRYGYMLS